ncbi:hypothetical protein [Nocardioides sp.]|uniref:hypothetical protein n=1 Tax=Nocardioides sp. TaxID=35761 RepID=UPI002B948A60|nr:hypothetical protein [Nocardioides sp.]HXH79544.1 hypothetical protein [Nocardioides sp.]
MTTTFQAVELTATVRNRDGATVEIVESAAYDARGDFIGYVWRCIAAGYRVELRRDVDTEGAG